MRPRAAGSVVDGTTDSGRRPKGLDVTSGPFWYSAYEESRRGSARERHDTIRAALIMRHRENPPRAQDNPVHHISNRTG